MQSERLHVIKRLFYFALSLAVLLAIGTVGYYYIGGGKYSLLDALFMTGITLTTVGYDQHIPLGDSDFAKIFTLLFSFSGIALFTYILSSVAAYVIEGEIQNSFRERTINRRIQKMNNHFIVCGAGRIGLEIIRELHQAKRPFVVIEQEDAKIKHMLVDFPEVSYIQANATEDEALIQAGVRKAVGIFAALGDDNANLVVGLTAKHLNARIKVIARALELSHVPKMEKAGADVVVSPYLIGARHMYGRMFHPHATEFMELQMTDTEGNIRVHEREVPTWLQNVQVSSLNLSELRQTLLIAVKEGTHYHFKPEGNFTLRQGHVLIFLASNKDWMRLQDQFADNA